MYEELVKRLRVLPHLLFVILHGHEDVVYQAADAIEELQAQLPKWIPVSERLPEEGRYVLVVYETIAGLLCHVSMLWTYATGDYYWDGLHGITPTHWMPLPEPPKEGTDG